MTWTYDVATDAGKVRLLCFDTDVAVADHRFFTDDEINAFLTLADGSVLLAAAEALDTIATSEVLIQKRLTLLDLKTDGPAEAKELHARAESLRDRSLTSEAPDWAELVLDTHTYSERIMNEALRDA